MSQVPTFFREPRFRYFRVALYVFLIFLVIEIGVRAFFARPDIVIRNAGNNDQAMEYLLEQLRDYKGKKVAFIGSSVMQGYLNAWDERAFPSMAEKILREKYGHEDLKAFNLGVAGASFADHLCILNKVMDADPDVIVQAIHFKLFSTHKATPITRPENAYYLMGVDGFASYLSRFRISPKDFADIWISHTLARFWRTFAHRNLITHLSTGEEHVAMQIVRRKLSAIFGFVTEEEFLARLHTPEEHNQEYLWKLLPEPLAIQNYEILGNFDFTDNNPQWQNFEDGAALAREHGYRLLYYLTPMNKPLIEERSFFDWGKVVPAYKENVYHVTRRNKHKLVDYSLAVHPANFSDTDHINMAGHEQVARRVAKDIDRELKDKRRR
ncbi:SGNH/GDSL hydrolase family protein [bacterium]|nr:SGNH/GDSL hydrolase family protein [bacterium]